MLIVLLSGGVAAVAFAAAYADRVLPGVRVGRVDLSGLDRAAASARLGAAFESARDGRVIVAIEGAPQAITYAEVGRRPDTERMTDDAFAVGRTGDIPARLADAARSLLNGVTIAPALTFDRAALSRRLAEIASATDTAAVDAAVTGDARGFTVRPAAEGRRLRQEQIAEVVSERLLDLGAPTEQVIEALSERIDPAIDDGAAERVRETAERLTADGVVLRLGDEEWRIPGAEVRPWVRFERTADGSYATSIDPDAPHRAVSKLASRIDRTPKDSTFAIGSAGAIVAGAPSVDGRSLDVHDTSAAIAAALDAATAGNGVVETPISPVVETVPPRLSSTDVARVAPLLVRLSTWTTRYTPSERNGYGANITIPARTIDGTVVLPGAVFDFWDAVGEVSPAKGYRPGGAIINGRTDPTGALGGGICSTSTTLFNAAARAGLDIVSRTAHYYYIDRYPVGLDATVFISSSGNRVTLAFRNDTPDPIVIRGFSTSRTVRFDIYGVPTGRTVTFSAPIVKNYRKATDETEETSAIPAGARERVEYPTDGFDSWVTRTVRDPDGVQLHEDTFYSHYARVDGLTLVGVAPRPEKSPTPGSPSENGTP